MLACVLTPLLLSACTVGPSQRPAVLMQDNPGRPGPARVEPAPLPPLGEPGPDVVGWAPCPESVTRRLDEAARKLTVECATITGTNDAQNLPDHGIVNIPLLRASKGGGDKVPLVVVDDIDGGPGTEHAAELAARLPARILDKMAVVGFDRRGTGGSNPVDCVPRRTRAELLDFDPAATDVEPLLSAIRKSGQECSIALGNEQSAYDSARTAVDLEEIRSHLGVPRLHAIARGDGSRVLTAYASRYTQQLGRVVLDGVPDPSKDAATVLADVAAGAETTLDAFADDCATRSACPLGDDARKSVTTLLQRLRTKVAYTAKDDPVGPGRAANSLWAGLRSPERWPELAVAVDQALDGKPDRLAAFTTAALEYRGDIPPTVDATMATTCNDTATRLSGDRIAEVAAEWREQYPVFGGLVAQRLLWCSQWPVRTEPLPGLDIPRMPPTLLVSTSADPLTPEKGSTRAADQLTAARRLSWLGAGHGAVGRSDCVDANVARLVVDGKIPRDGVACPA